MMANTENGSSSRASDQKTFRGFQLCLSNGVNMHVNMHDCTHILHLVHLRVYMLGVWTCTIGCTRGNVIYMWLGHTHAVEHTHANVIYKRCVTGRAELI